MPSTAVLARSIQQTSGCSPLPCQADVLLEGRLQIDDEISGPLSDPKLANADVATASCRSGESGYARGSDHAHLLATAVSLSMAGL